MKISFNEQKNYFYTDEIPALAGLHFLVSASLEIEQLKIRIETILNYILKHNSFRDIVLKNLQSGNISVEFCKHSKMTSVASWDLKKRLLSIRQETTGEFDLLHSFIFEMHNAANSKLKLVDDWQGYKTGDEYALACEQAEWETYNNTVKTLLEEIRTFDEPKLKSEDILPKEQTWDEYYTKMTTPELAYHGYSHYGSYVCSFYKHLQAIEKIKLDTQYRILGIHQKGLSDHEKLVNQYQDVPIPDEIKANSTIISNDIQTTKNQIVTLTESLKKLTDQIQILEDQAKDAKTKLETEEKRLKPEIEKSQQDIKNLEHILDLFKRASEIADEKEWESIDRIRLENQNDNAKCLTLLEPVVLQLEARHLTNHSGILSYLPACKSFLSYFSCCLCRCRKAPEADTKQSQNAVLKKSV